MSPVGTTGTLTFTTIGATSPADDTAVGATGTIRFTPTTGTASGSTTPTIPLPSLLVVRRGGATFIDTTTGTPDNGLLDCNLLDIKRQPNAWDVSALQIPITRTDFLAQLLTTDLQIDRTAVIDVTIGSDLLRFRLTGRRLVDVSPGRSNAVEFALADRRYSINSRYVGRVGGPPNLVPTFYGSGTPTGWTINGGAADTVTIDPYGGLGAFNTAGTAMHIGTSGAGAGDYVSTTITLATRPYTRTVEASLWEYIPLGGAAANADGLLAEVVVTDLVGPTEVTPRPQMLIDAATTASAWFSPNTKITIPENLSYQLEFRIYGQSGDIYVDDPNITDEEGLFWSEVDAGQILRDLVAHASDTANWGHSDTGVRATVTSIPNTGVTVSRTIKDTNEQRVLAALQEIGNLAGTWQRLVAETDGTDTLYIDTAGTVCTTTATDQNADLGNWEGGVQAGVLGLYAPDQNDFAGRRIIAWVGPSGPLYTRGQAWDLGDELRETGPPGSYDARVVGALVQPFYNAKQQALSVPVTLVYDPATVTDFTSGNLRPGCLMNVNIGTWPVGMTGQLRINTPTLHTDSWQVTVELNRGTT